MKCGRTGLLWLALLLAPGLAGANAAVDELLDSAAAHVVAGEPDRAASDLERALRIEPRNPAIWHDLGQVRMHQGRYRDAITLAERSDGLAGDDAELRRRNANLIATARALAGDPPVPASDSHPAEPAPTESIRPVASTRPVAPDLAAGTRIAEFDAYSPPPPWYQPPPAFADPTLGAAPDFAELALAVLPVLLGIDPGYSSTARRDAYNPPPLGYGDPYASPSELYLELAPGLGISVRMPGQGRDVDPLAAGLIDAVIGAVGARAAIRDDRHHEFDPSWQPSQRRGPPPWAARGRGRD